MNNQVAKRLRKSTNSQWPTSYNDVGTHIVSYMEKDIKKFSEVVNPLTLTDHCSRKAYKQLKNQYKDNARNSNV